MALPTADRADLARQWASRFFITPNVTANLDHNDIMAAIGAIDDALDAQVNTLGVSGSAVLLNALVGLLPEPFKSRSTAAQKAAVYSYVFFRRAGVI